MRIVEISALENGAHRNQSWDLSAPPEGWALIPDELETLNFPFGDIVVEEIEGIVTVTNWTPGVIPEPEPEPDPTPTAQEDNDAMLVDHEYRITLLELGITEV